MLVVTHTATWFPMCSTSKQLHFTTIIYKFNSLHFCCYVVISLVQYIVLFCFVMDSCMYMAKLCKIDGFCSSVLHPKKDSSVWTVLLVIGKEWKLTKTLGTLYSIESRYSDIQGNIIFHHYPGVYHYDRVYLTIT